MSATRFPWQAQGIAGRTLDPVAVHDAAHALAALAQRAGCDMGAVRAQLRRRPTPAGDRVDDATALFARVVAYLDGAS